MSQDDKEGESHQICFGKKLVQLRFVLWRVCDLLNNAENSADVHKTSHNITMVVGVAIASDLFY